MHRKSRLSRDEEGCRAHRTGIRGNHGVLPRRSVRRSRQPSSARYSQAPLLRTQRRAFLHKLYLAGLILWVPLLLGALSEPTWRYLPGVYIFVSSVLRLPELTAGFAAMARAHRTS